MGGTCPNCGRRIDGRQEFCTGCGVFLGWDAAGSAESQLHPQPAQPEDQRAAVQLQVKNDLIKVTPGSSESTTVTAKNLGTQVEQLRFDVTGPAWITVEPAVVSVYPGQEASGAVQVAPPRAPTSVAGITPFQIRVTSAFHRNVSSSVACRTDVAAYFDLKAELVPTSSTGRGMTRHTVRLENRGNVPVRIGLSPTDVAHGLRVGMPAFTDLGPGAVSEVPVSVRSSLRFVGRPEPKTFSVIAEGQKPLAPARLPGTRIVIPLLPRWVPAMAVGVAAVAVAAAVLIPKLHPRPSALNSHVSPPASSAAASSSPSASPSPTPTATLAAAPFDLLAQAQNAMWLSRSSHGSLATPVSSSTGCPARTSFASDSEGGVFDVSGAPLPDGSVATTALETDPPLQPSASVAGTYTLPTPTAAGETFYASIAFCGATTGPNVQYQVTFGSTPQYQLPLPTVPTNNSFGSIMLPVPAGTTEVQLSVTDVSGSNADIVWADAAIEPAGASPPEPP